ncbi:hypothetical protein Syun_011442 [Stephania yunnanensis]|uniref:Cytochrome b5 heme-binding domain-containing protein n=1 Tax=Stephania yunnanensis TaxID=152371 RepID=A0AAP0PFG0_9MAGN
MEEVVWATLVIGVLIATALLFISRIRKDSDAKPSSSNPHDKVYDVTSYVEEHPGGDAILAHAGDDSTEGFYGPQHATRVFDMISDFFIGDLASN